MLLSGFLDPGLENKYKGPSGKKAVVNEPIFRSIWPGVNFCGRLVTLKNIISRFGFQNYTGSYEDPAKIIKAGSYCFFLPAKVFRTENRINSV
jgi:hypothetical protein